MWSITRKTLELQGHNLQESPVCSSALTQARQAIGTKPFENLFKIGTEKQLKKHDELTRFNGFRLHAMDGSNLNLHSNPLLDKAFGRPHSTGKRKSRPQASFTTLQLVETGLIVDYCLDKYDASELDHTKRLAERLGIGDLLLGDRLSFDTRWFLELDQREVKFLFRATRSRYKSFTKQSQETIKKMMEHGNVDCIVDLKIRGNASKTIKLRYIEIVREGLETLRFITNLSLAEFSLEEIATLYRPRWEIETEFRLFKGQDHLEVILSRTEETVRQEVLTRVIAHNAVRYIQSEACAVVAEETRNIQSEECVEPAEEIQNIQSEACAEPAEEMQNNETVCKGPCPEISQNDGDVADACKETPCEDHQLLDGTATVLLKPKKELIRISTDKKWMKKSLLWPTKQLRPVDLQFNNSLALIVAYIINQSIYSSPDPAEAWSKLLSNIVKASIWVKDGRSYYRKGKSYGTTKVSKGNRKAQYKNKQKREKQKAVGETE